jgi:hypothetical protein
LRAATANTGRPPFYSRDRETLFARLRNASHLTFPAGVSDNATDLCTKLLARVPQSRLGTIERGGADTLRRHRFFKGLDWDELLARHVEPPFSPRCSNTQRQLSMSDRADSSWSTDTGVSVDGGGGSLDTKGSSVSVDTAGRVGGLGTDGYRSGVDMRKFDSLYTDTLAEGVGGGSGASGVAKDASMLATWIEAVRSVCNLNSIASTLGASTAADGVDLLSDPYLGFEYACPETAADAFTAATAAASGGAGLAQPMARLSEPLVPAFGQVPAATAASGSLMTPVDSK